VTRSHSSYASMALAALLVALAPPTRLAAQDGAPAPAPAAAPAQPAPAAAATPPASQDEDDDAALRPLEPDFELINLPTTLPLPLHKSNFHLTHRFGGNLRGRSFGDVASDFFGIDEGATIGLEYRYAILKHVEVGAVRTNFARTIEIFGKYDWMHQSAKHPVGISGVLSVEGTNNFRQEYAPTIGASVSRTVANAAALYATPMWVHNSAAVTGVMRDTFLLGVGGRLRVLRTVFVVAEVTPRVAGYKPGDNEYGFGLEKRVGGHDFMLTVTNSFGSTNGQLARGGSPQSLFLGFNLSRKFF
jgi:hypothetical protein